ncbi:hypothetical protein KAR91_41775 [Candidatus Pacearchaeota archaeon]|nr:hypothetical protein [Candidatus Pacearchaeota archaeon]
MLRTMEMQRLWSLYKGHFVGQGLTEFKSALSITDGSPYREDRRIQAAMMEASILKQMEGEGDD